MRVKQNNSLYYWYKVKNPLIVILNVLVIFIFGFSPSLRLKNLLYRALGAKIHKSASLALSVVLDCFFPELIEIGENSILGFRTTVLTHEFLTDEFRTGKVKIGKNVMIGACSLVIAGVEIGDNTTVAAFSLVNKDLPSNAFAAGVPARVIRMKNQTDEMLNILQFTSLKRFSQLSHGITTRHFKPDISTSQGQSYFLKINRADQSTLILPKQIHSSEILIIERKDLSLKKEQLVGDAVITNQLNIWIGILVADCFPILIFDPINRVVAVVHAGWRGIEQNIHLKTIYYLCKFVKCSLKNLFIGIGPGIGSCCFEVEKEVSEKFKKRSSATQLLLNTLNYAVPIISVCYL